MVTKAIVEDASNPCYVKVRIPTYDAIEDARGGTLNKDLSYATICALSNSDNNVQNGDVVFVSFEDDDLGKPVIIGHLVKEEKDESYSDASFRLLNTKSTTTLYKDTYIGDVTPQEIASLKGIKFNIQEQFNNINTNGTYIQQGGTLTAPLTVTGGDGSGAGKLILDDTTYGQITNKGTATLFGFISPATLTVGHSTFNLSLRGKQTNPTYNGNSVALTSDISTAISNAKLDIYPVGTIYICISREVLASSPASWLGGTWELLPEGYALWTASSGAGNTISAGLPNIGGKFFVGGNTMGTSESSRVGGAIRSGNNGDISGEKGGGGGSDNRVFFNARLGDIGTATSVNENTTYNTSSVYGNSTTVQPPAYKVYAWKRVPATPDGHYVGHAASTSSFDITYASGVLTVTTFSYSTLHYGSGGVPTWAQQSSEPLTYVAWNNDQSYPDEGYKLVFDSTNGVWKAYATNNSGAIWTYLATLTLQTS